MTSTVEGMVSCRNSLKQSHCKSAATGHPPRMNMSCSQSVGIIHLVIQCIYILCASNAGVLQWVKHKRTGAERKAAQGGIHSARRLQSRNYEVRLQI